jgi:hypothetical protein
MVVANFIFPLILQYYLLASGFWMTGTYENENAQKYSIYLISFSKLFQMYSLQSMAVQQEEPLCNY